MPQISQVDLIPALEVARIAPALHAWNGIRYGVFGETQLSALELEQIVQAIPLTIASALQRKAYYFVPLTLDEAPETMSGDEASEPGSEHVMIASEFSPERADISVCHRNATLAGEECVFISTRLMQDRFALAFEFYINAARHFVEVAGVPQTFMNLVWTQTESHIRGETSQDAWESRARAIGHTDTEPDEREGYGVQTRQKSRIRRLRARRIDAAQASTAAQYAVDEKARSEYFDAAFADAIAIYLLSLTVDFDYLELREREYPLLAAPALADRLHLVAQLFPPNPGHEFSIRYGRRDG